LAEIADLIETRAVSAPAIIVVGEVVRLREKLGGFILPDNGKMSLRPAVV
jgi:siroheme synthase